MNSLKITEITEKGENVKSLEYEISNEKGFEITETEFDKHFDLYVQDGASEYKEMLLKENKVCFKQTISTIEHPFQAKTEWDWAIIKIPFNGTIKEKINLKFYRRTVKYVVFAEICYPVDLIITHVERCAKQGAIAAAAVALTGNISAAQNAFQTAFFACMALADFPNADKIGIRVAGEKIHGSWKRV